MISNYNLSFIVLCHNNYNITSCLNSIRKQLGDFDEIILVDDNSNQKTQKILEEYLKKYNQNIKFIKSIILGNRSANRNLGVKYSKNEVLVFIDGDMVIGNNAVETIRNAHVFREEIAFVGNKHFINYDELQLSLVSSITDYKKKLNSYEGLSYLEANPMFFDYRKKLFSRQDINKYNWTMYYTGLSTVEKQYFYQAGQFDENFLSWGSEDVDLGYRLSKLGKIGFINELHGFHIPHKRAVIENEISNRENMLYMYNKYKTWEFEILNSFYGFGGLEQFEKVISMLILIKLKKIKPTLKNGEIFIDIFSKDYPNGRIILHKNDKNYYYTGFGTIDIYNTEIKKVYLSDHIFIYPQVIFCRIIQSALKLSKNVVIYQTSDSIRIPWDYEKILLPKPQKQHYEHDIQDIFAFKFSTNQNKEICVNYIDGILI